ncbi:retrovirus-related pol polyprotein from transposon TNT 1-94 [Tanacetum coccineum]
MKEYGMFKLDIEALSPKLKNNRDAYEVYIEKTIKYADTLRGFVERARTHEKLVVVTPINKNKRVRFAEPVTSSNNIPKQTGSFKTKDSNKPLLTSTRVKPTTSSNGSKPTGNTKKNRITRPPRSNQKNKVEDHPRKVKSSLNKMNFVSEPISNELVKHSVRNAKFKSICAICNKCLFDANHDMCLVDFVNDVNVHSKSKSKRNKKSKAWKLTGKVFTDVGYKWKPTGIFFTIVDVPSSSSLVNDTFPDRPLVSGLWMFKTHDREPLSAHELHVEVAFLKNTCFIRNLEGVDLLPGSHDTNLYTISLDDMLKTSLICLLSKALKTNSWLWHRRLSHLNFGTLNKLAKDGLTRGIPKLKFQKDHLCSARALGKSKKSSHQPKAEDTNQEKLYLLHMDLCGVDEALDAIIKCIKNIQVRLNAIVRNVRTDNGTEFVNQTLRDFYENVGISHQTSVTRTLQQNGVVER